MRPHDTDSDVWCSTRFVQVRPQLGGDYSSSLSMAQRLELVHRVEEWGLQLRVLFVELDFILPDLLESFLDFFINFDLLVSLFKFFCSGILERHSADISVFYPVSVDGSQPCHRMTFLCHNDISRQTRLFLRKY